jgi:hypothetical protein
MDRRELLGAGALAGVGMAGSTGCSANSALIGEPAMAQPDLDAFIVNLDSSMQSIRTSTFVAGFAEKLGGRAIPHDRVHEVAQKEQMFRDVLGTLFLTQSFRDLPRESQMHPEVQRRMVSEIDKIDGTVFEVANLLENLSGRERTDLQRVLRKHPELAMQIAETVDEQAATAGISRERRLQLRSMMTQAAFRLRHHPPGVLIDEYVAKVRRATTQAGAQFDLAMRVAVESGERAFWEQHMAAGAGIPLAASTRRPPSTWTDPDDPEVIPPGSAVIKTGAILLGIGVLVFGVSALIFALGAFPGVYGMTVGVVLFAAGLITLIVGALIRATSS